MPTSKEMSDNKWDRFREICHRQALKMLKNSAMAEDAAQEALLLALPHIQAGKIKNLGAYLRQVTRNYCLEILKTPADVSLSTPIQGRNEGAESLTLLDLVPARPESEEKSSINPFEALKKRDSDKAAAIMESIEMVDDFYRGKKKLHGQKLEDMILYNFTQSMNAVCKRLHLSTGGFESNKLKRFVMLNKKHANLTLFPLLPYYRDLKNEPGLMGERTIEEEAEWGKLLDDIFWLRLEQKFYNLRNHIDEHIYTDPLFNPHYKRGGPFSGLPAMKMKIAPIKLLINVWHKGLKRGRKYGDLGLIKELARYFKKEYENTPKAYLFSGLTDSNFNTLRKRSLYSRNKIFKKLAKTIYQWSFRPEIT